MSNLEKYQNKSIMIKNLIIVLLLLVKSNYLFAQSKVDTAINKKYSYNVTIDYQDTYAQLIRSNDSIIKSEDSSLVEFRIITTLGEQLSSKYDTVGLKDGSGISYFGRDSATQVISGFIKYRGAKKIWVQGYHLFEIWDTISFTIERDNKNLPLDYRSRLVRVEYVVPELYNSGGKFWHDQVYIECEKALSAFQISEIRFYFLATGKLKEEYSKEYNCECITMYTQSKAKTE